MASLTKESAMRLTKEKLIKNLATLQIVKTIDHAVK
jgi:hypothetical protein